MRGYQAVIGVEIHVQIQSKRKQFCSCPAVNTREISDANKFTCPICLGHPGVLPVLNSESVRNTLLLGIRLNCNIAKRSIFARKNYFYPDLPKGYQITQYHTPLLTGGEVEYFYEGQLKKAPLERAHLEEDTAKIFYLEDGTNFLDFNRAGIPLLEIVTEPVFTSPREVVAFLEELRFILRELEISEANMEEGNFRCEPNISVRPLGSTKLLTKTEIKNLNSFGTLIKALEYEIQRQTEVWESGEKVERETMRWDEHLQKTVPMRMKETQADYRYFDEPDLPPLVITDEQIEMARREAEKYQRKLNWDGRELIFPAGTARQMEFLVSTLFLSTSDAKLFALNPEYLELLSEVYQITRDLKETIIWLLQEYKPLSETLDVRLSPNIIAELIQIKKQGAVTTAQARKVLALCAKSGKSVQEAIEELGFGKTLDDEEMTRICGKVIEENSKAVNDIRRGKVQALKVLVGAVMKETGGRANPIMVEEKLKYLLNL